MNTIVHILRILLLSLLAWLILVFLFILVPFLFRCVAEIYVEVYMNAHKLSPFGCGLSDQFFYSLF